MSDYKKLNERKSNMELHFTDERNAQIVVSLLKAHGIKKVVASPGTTNICLVGSMQNDPWFEMYSAAEERSAGYIACGLAAESNEPVVITCTGATASRNYMPALTEAYYRKLPVIAITCSRRSSRIGHNIDQVTDRTTLPNDIAKISVQVPMIHDEESEWADIIAVNKALLETNHHGKGPVHINLETNYSRNYSVEKLPKARAIFRFGRTDERPRMVNGRVAIMVGAHTEWTPELTQTVEKFCEINNGLVLCDHISNYKGKYAIHANLMALQTKYICALSGDMDLLIHIGEVHAPAYTPKAKEVWRVSEDGELKDTFRKLTKVFEMTELEFFSMYADGSKKEMEYYNALHQEEMFAQEEMMRRVDELPLSHGWIAANTSRRLPENSEVHFGIQNSLRFWNFCPLPPSVLGFCNTGGFGIDGNISATIGASLHNPDKLYFCVLGDLAFFYDMNSLGNRHIGKNLRILLVNNGKGGEFKLYGNPGALFGEQGDLYIAAAGHYGKQSRSLVKHYAEDLGFHYIAAQNKEEYIIGVEEFLTQENIGKPILFEVFTNTDDESNALKFLSELVVDRKMETKKAIKSSVKSILGENATGVVKKILGKN